MSDFDLIVIGSGPAGEKGAAQAAYFGKRVALVERHDRFGGASVNTGTVPSKTLRETALYFSGLRQRGLYGLDYSLREGLTVADFLHRMQAVVDDQRRLIAENLDRHGITVVRGEARFVDGRTLEVRHAGESRQLTAPVILIATGSSPLRPPDVPFDDRLVYDSDSILRMDRIPRTLAVVGGGVIGSEYASVFTALGVQVTLVDGRDRLLPFTDHDIAERLRARLEGLGQRFVFNARVARTTRGADEVRLALDTGAELVAERALFAAGRQSNVETLRLERAGVTVGKRGLIPVDAHYRTNVPGIYAAGDVIGFPALASTSMEQARVAMAHAFELGYKERMSPVLPLAVYTVPEIGMAGLTEAEARAAGEEVEVGRAEFARNARGQIIGDTSGLLKLVFRAGDKRLLGVHLVGELASELVHLGAEVLRSGGTIDAFIEAVYNWPTLSDAYKYAAYDGLGRLRARR
ncbi:MAG TPA: Si-specific NAD(P)(+) transhydrogenase [Gemmatimonadales bacterium]|nr:Si-specific NAD(P)(+) transhydrogenase [Gemmatimonadales bacterium]